MRNSNHIDFDILYPNSNVDTLQIFRDKDWDFKDVVAGSGVYGIHPYPAMFHFNVVRNLLIKYSKEGDTILDPFMGSGVAAVECLINNRNFFGYDINPLAVLIAKVRSTPLNQKLLLETLHALLQQYRRNEPESVEFHNIDYWFDKNIIDDLSKLRRAIFGIDDYQIKAFFKVVFSETVRKSSKTVFSEFKLLRNKKYTSNVNVLKIFREISFKNIGLLSDFYKNESSSNVSIIVENRNILESFPVEDNSIDLVITSPPYGDSKTTVAYGQFSRLSLRWLGLKENVDKTSLGGKPKDIIGDLPSSILYDTLNKIEAKNGKRAREVFSFYFELYNAVTLISKKIKHNGYVCFIVGNRRVMREELPTCIISANFFERQGFKHVQTIIRDISNKRMPAVNSPTNIKGRTESTMRSEYIVVLKKM